MSVAGRRGARRLALQALYQHQLTGDAVEELCAQFRGRPEHASVDAGYFDWLLRAVLADVAGLDARIAGAADRPVHQLDPVEHAVLWIGLAELGTARVPVRVAIDEAVELAKTFGAQNSHRYVNAILDRAAAR